MQNPKYDEAFRKSAIALVETGQTVAQVARDLGVPAKRLYIWRKHYGSVASTHGNATTNLDEVTRLRRELARAQAELEILKKAVFIFSQTERR